jgi:hypothetical protein
MAGPGGSNALVGGLSPEIGHHVGRHRGVFLSGEAPAGAATMN